MANHVVIDRKTKIIKNVISGDVTGYDPPNGRELVKGNGKIGEVFKPKPAAKKKPTETMG